ncbi:MAG: BrnA antitoxin family protein [Deltaproteobacteria bacterium]|nr:BrnA antitoxin family protein [Deltaproteobacteria bacterium]
MAKKKISYGNKDLLGDADFDPKTAKERITIWLDEVVLDAFRGRARAEGTKYQTLVNQALREAIHRPSLIERVERLEKKLGTG